MAKSASRSEHRANQLLATLAPADFVALEPHLETVKLSKSTTVYETGDDMPYAYFPHDAVVSLITVLTDGKTVEVAVFGREALLGLTSALATCRSLGRYVVQVSGTASRVDTGGPAARAEGPTGSAGTLPAIHRGADGTGFAVDGLQHGTQC